ncbi:MAG: histidine kinase [Ferruginibacter sp.]|uniref:GAF domain-containing sensor histidine kinase n=1 Tax=Ferruginibacter sp. TaxID=1940288 RepID=UPI00265B44FC|nr:GAF domain-containing sensor histidine kinase [Ferruginibacter sp.]MDB5280643.1 histidine kinase [Ferruginibacter sp.]
MQLYPLPKNEKQRLQALYDYGILDTLSEKEYDSITKIAAQICNVPASLITFLDKDRQWFKSHLGISIKETPRELSFCNYTIIDPDKVLVVPDLRVDERFYQNPLVTGEPNAVFYAGAPLITPDGFVLGSICVLDGKINNLTDEQFDALKGLAQQVVTRLELQKKIKELNLIQKKLKEANKNLKSFAHIVSHDMKTPLANILLVSRSFKKNYEQYFDENAVPYFDLIDKSAKELLVFIDEILIQSENINKDARRSETLIDSHSVLIKVIDLVAPPADIEINLKGEFPKVPMNKISLQQVFQNLITNAIKYNDKEKGEINITCMSDNSFHYFQISDNGSGMEKQDLAKIFKERQTLNKIDRFGNTGTGIGLASVKNILETCGGKIMVTSEKNTVSTFKICIPFNKN